MEILIGREAGSARLLVRVDGKDKFYGNAGSVPNSVSRKHCKLVRDSNNCWSIVNVKPENITYVKGMQVDTKHIAIDDVIELGKDRYLLNLKAIVAVIEKEHPRSYSISPLEKVWTDYHQTKLNIQIKEKKSAAIRSVTGIFSMSAVACGFIPGIADVVALRVFLYAIGFLVGIYFFVVTYRSSSKLPLFMDKLERDFRKNYACPNPDCKRFMGNQPYEDVRRMGSCPYCKSQFTDEHTS